MENNFINAKFDLVENYKVRLYLSQNEINVKKEEIKEKVKLDKTRRKVLKITQNVLYFKEKIVINFLIFQPFLLSKQFQLKKYK